MFMTVMAGIIAFRKVIIVHNISRDSFCIGNFFKTPFQKNENEAPSSSTFLLK